MTEQEAIEQLKTMYPKICKMIGGRYTGGHDDHTSKGGTALDIAIEALERQIPKVPIDKIMYKECPVCGAVDLGRYCMECGQAIKWE